MCRLTRSGGPSISRTKALPSPCVDVWLFDLDVPDGSIQPEQVVSAQEHVKASSFRRNEDRRRYFYGRARLRQVLSSYLDCRADDVELGIKPLGKPILTSSSHSWLHFSISHSGQFYAVGVSADRKIGVDIELRDHSEWMPPLLRTICHIDEIDALRRADLQNQARALLHIFIAKEAFLKGIGIGLQSDPRLVTTELRITPSECFVDGATHIATKERWDVAEIVLGSVCLAVAHEIERPMLRFMTQSYAL